MSNRSFTRTQAVLLCGLAAILSAQGQTYRVLTNLNSTNEESSAALTRGSDGNLYGTTTKGQTYGTVFRITPSGTVTTLHTFVSTDGSSPTGGVIFAADGNMYGTTNLGGTNSLGTVYQLTPGGSFTSLYSFAGGTTDGSGPVGKLVQAGDGYLYGVTNSGGANSCGTIYRINTQGGYASMYSFACPTDGGYPRDGLVLASDGNLYGTATSAGAANYGSAFRFGLDGAYTLLHAFGGAEGHTPNAGLIQATDGMFYGTTELGGSAGVGTIFQLTSDGTMTILYNFTGMDGRLPLGPLLQGADGNFYGTTDEGGTAGYGTVFTLTPDGQFTRLHSFTAADGESPVSGLVEGPAGTFYGTTFSGGINNEGVVFSLTYSAPRTPAPAINSGGVVPVFSAVPIVQTSEWVSIYGNNLATKSATWNNDFPVSLAQTSVTIGGKQAYLWYVSSNQINLQVPDGLSAGGAAVIVTTPGGTASGTVTIAAQAPAFSLLDSKHVAGIILRSDGSGAYGNGAYDILGPMGAALGYETVAAKAGDMVELFGVGFGATSPTVAAGELYSGAAATVAPVTVNINGTAVTPGFTGLSSAGLYQLNVRIPAGMPAGDVRIQAAVSGSQTQADVVISLQ